MTRVEEARPRRGRPGHDQRAVIAAAVAVFDEHGYDATTMGMIAHRLGVSKSAIYHHVGSKEELLTLALDTAFAALDEAITAAAEAEAPLEERCSGFLRDLVAVLIEYRPFVRLLLRLRGNSPAEEEALRRRREFDARMSSLVEEAKAAGLVRADLDPTVVARLVFGAVNSTVEWYRPTGRISPEEVTRTVLTVVLHGIAAPRE